MERPHHEEGSRTNYVVRTFHQTQPPKTWHVGTLKTCRAWIKKEITIHAGKSSHPLPVMGIYKKHITWTLDLVE